MMSFVWRAFQVCEGRWWKKIQEGLELKLGDAPDTLKKYSRRPKRLSLGMPPCIPFFINNYQFVLLHAIFLSLHILCALLGASCCLLFSFALFNLVLFAGHNKLDPGLLCLGEKHAPLLPRMLIVFTSIFLSIQYLLPVVVIVQLLFFMFISF